MNISFILKRLALFLVIYLGCLFLFASIPSARSAHAGFFSAFLPFTNNVLNPNVYIMIEDYEGTENYDVATSLYNRKKFGARLKNARSRSTIKPAYIINRNSYSLVFLPTLFLISLIVATPNKWTKKLRDSIIGVFFIYLFMAFYLGYRYETTMYSKDPEGFQPESLWDYLVTWIGGFGNQEYVYIVVVFIWAILSIRPEMLKRFSEET